MSGFSQEWGKAAESTVGLLEINGKSLKDWSLTEERSLAGFLLIQYQCYLFISVPFFLHS